MEIDNNVSNILHDYTWYNVIYDLPYDDYTRRDTIYVFLLIFRF